MRRKRNTPIISALRLFAERPLFFAGKVDFSLVSEHKVSYEEGDERGDDEAGPPPAQHDIDGDRSDVGREQPERQRALEFSFGYFRRDRCRRL